MTVDNLATQAEAFANELTQTVRALVPNCPPFVPQLLTDRASHPDRFVVRQDPDRGIPLNVDGQPLLTLKVEYFCCLDGHDRYLAIDRAQFHVFAGKEAKKEPLFRYEYKRSAAPDMPAAHVHVHGHRDGLSHVIAKAGTGTRRARARAADPTIPRMADLHFPVGGHRFRPCLEDVLEMLVTELGVDHPEGAIESLRRGRETWRRKQVRTVVRDAPEEAVAALESLGYSVTLLEGAEIPKDNVSRLRDF